MAVEIVMPRLSDSMEEGTVAKWLVGVGDSVERGQPLVEIDTDKATMEYEVEPLSRVQQAVVRHMLDAAAVPTFATEVEVDMTASAELRTSLDPRPSFNDLVVKACALALREHPRVNAHYTDAGFSYPEGVNVGIAVAAQ